MLPAAFIVREIGAAHQADVCPIRKSDFDDFTSLPIAQIKLKEIQAPFS
jgi:hypothetical protein